MILGSGCLGVRALDGGAIAEALAATGLRRVLLVARPGARPAGLAGLPASGVRVGWNERSGGCDLARAARASRLVLEPSATLELEDACRELHALGRAHAGLALAVTPAPAGPLAEPESLRLLLEDLASMRAGYWHRPARAHRLGRPDSDWLQPLSRWLVGLSLDDVTGSEEGPAARPRPARLPRGRRLERAQPGRRHRRRAAGRRAPAALRRRRAGGGGLRVSARRGGA
jgi:hypothetical protein